MAAPRSWAAPPWASPGSWSWTSGSWWCATAWAPAPRRPPAPVWLPRRAGIPTPAPGSAGIDSGRMRGAGAPGLPSAPRSARRSPPRAGTHPHRSSRSPASWTGIDPVPLAGAGVAGPGWSSFPTWSWVRRSRRRPKPAVRPPWPAVRPPWPVPSWASPTAAAHLRRSRPWDSPSVRSAVRTRSACRSRSRPALALDSAADVAVAAPRRQEPRRSVRARWPGPWSLRSRCFLSLSSRLDPHEGRGAKRRVPAGPLRRAPGASWSRPDLRPCDRTNPRHVARGHLFPPRHPAVALRTR